MKKVKVFDAKLFLEKSCGEQMAAKGLEVRDQFAVLVGEKKVIVTGDEAVHDIFTLDEEVVIDLFAKARENEDGSRSISIVPSARVKIPVLELIEELDKPEFVKEQPLTEFVRRFGSRIENNYRILLKSIKEIGLNPADYPRE